MNDGRSIVTGAPSATGATGSGAGGFASGGGGGGGAGVSVTFTSIGAPAAGDDLTLEGNEPVAIEPQPIGSGRHILEDDAPALGAGVAWHGPCIVTLTSPMPAPRDRTPRWPASQDRRLRRCGLRLPLRRRLVGGCACVGPDPCVQRDRSRRDERDQNCCASHK